MYSPVNPSARAVSRRALWELRYAYAPDSRSQHCVLALQIVDWCFGSIPHVAGGTYRVVVIPASARAVSDQGVSPTALQSLANAVPPQPVE